MAISRYHVIYDGRSLDSRCAAAIVKHHSALHAGADPHLYDISSRHDTDALRTRIERALNPSGQLKLQDYLPDEQRARDRVLVVAGIDPVAEMLDAFGTVEHYGAIDQGYAEQVWHDLFSNRPAPLSVQLLSLYAIGGQSDFALWRSMVLPLVFALRSVDTDPHYYSEKTEWGKLFKLQGTHTTARVKEGLSIMRYLSSVGIFEKQLAMLDCIEDAGLVVPQGLQPDEPEEEEEDGEVVDETPTAPSLDDFQAQDADV